MEFRQRGLLTPCADLLNYQITSHSAPYVYMSLSFECCQHQFHLGKRLEIGWAQTFPSLWYERITIWLGLWGQTDHCKHLKIPVHGTKPFSSSVFVVTVASLVFGLLLSCGTPYVPPCNRVLTLHVNVAYYYQPAVLLLSIVCNVVKCR